jgi:hypothetical protein
VVPVSCAALSAQAAAGIDLLPDDDFTHFVSAFRKAFD